MELNELKEDLLGKTNSCYFKVKILKSDNDIYRRRSFDDLFKYYKSKKVTEKLLLQALYESNFVGRLCGDIHKIVFRSVDKKKGCEFLGNQFAYDEFEDEFMKDSKYTPSYLKNLFKSLNIEEDN